MTLAKADLVESLIQKIRFKAKQRRKQRVLFPEMEYERFTRKRAAKVVDSVFEIIKEALAGGEDVLISGFGKFQVKFRWARRGRNPQTGEKIILPSRRVVTFRTSRKLRERLNR